MFHIAYFLIVWLQTNRIQNGGEGGVKRKEPAEGESEEIVAHEQEEEAQPSTSGAPRWFYLIYVNFHSFNIELTQFAL